QELAGSRACQANCQGSSNNPHLWSLKIPHPSQQRRAYGRQIVERRNRSRTGHCSRDDILREVQMVREDCWREVHRRFHGERQSKSEIARQLDLDRKTVRTILREPVWRPYRRVERTDTLLLEHARYLEQRAP